MDTLLHQSLFISLTTAWVTSHVMIESGRIPYVPNDSMVIEIYAYNVSVKDELYLWGSLHDDL